MLGLRLGRPESLWEEKTRVSGFENLKDFRGKVKNEGWARTDIK